MSKGQIYLMKYMKSSNYSSSTATAIPGTIAKSTFLFVRVYHLYLHLKSTLKRVKNVLQLTMKQQRLSSLGVLAVGAQLAKIIDMNEAINDVAT